VKYQRLLALALIVAASAGLASLADTFGGLTGVEALRYTTLDWREQTTTESFQQGYGDRSSDVVLVLFDELSVTDPEMGWLWEQPYPRGEIARVIDAVSSAGARTIGLDVFLELQEPELNELTGGDDALRAAMERAGNVILVGPLAQTDSGPVLERPDTFFLNAAAGLGGAELPTAFETVREGTLAVRSGGSLKPSFALALYAHASGMDADSLMLQAKRWGRVALPGLPPSVGNVPEDWWEQGTSSASSIVPFTLRFYGPPSSGNADDPPGTFPAVSSSTVDLAATFNPELFKDKIVLIGSGFHDSDKFRTPFFQMEAPPDSTRADTRTYGYMYGVELHANALQDMLDGDYVRPLGARSEALLLLLAALLTGGAVFWKGAGWGGFATVGTLLGLVVAAFWSWAGQAYGPGGSWFDLGAPFLWLPMVSPGVAAVFSYVGSVGYVSVVEGREKRFIKGAFSKYVSPEVVADIAENPEALQLGGQKRPLSLLFSDLAGFTTLSERMDPQDLLAHLNEYLSDMTQIVMDEQGTLDKYIGDAIMAFWNAPKDVSDHADRALRTAILMQRRMEELNARWRENDPDAETLVVRIGVNTGTVVVGNVGGRERFDYSAIGDAVNLAARLEPANKTYDTLVMASEFTLDHARREDYRVRELDLIAVKGKVEPVRVYEVLEMAGTSLSPEREEALRHFEAGMAAYKGRDWTLAAEYFGAALEADPTDGPSRVYLARAEEYAEAPPPADWDFVVRRTTK
jgi:adenylate cyclase